MIQDIIDIINNIITKGTLILYKSEINKKYIKSLHEVIYQIYIKTYNIDNPIMILSISRIKNIGVPNDDIEKEVIQKLLKFIMEGGLSSYE